LGLQTRPDQAAAGRAGGARGAGRLCGRWPDRGRAASAAKDNLIGGFALRIDTNRKLLDNVAGIAWNDLPLDYLDTWTQQVDRVSVADIKAAFARKLQPRRMATVVVGGAPRP
jgi:zinc protease